MHKTIDQKKLMRKIVSFFKKLNQKIYNAANKYKVFFLYNRIKKKTKGSDYGYGGLPTTSTKTRLSDGKLICWSCVLFFLKRGSGHEYNDEDPTDHESFELSLSTLNTASITALGLPGFSSRFLF